MKYVKCAHCGKRIPVGGYGFGLKELPSIYCSKICFAEAYGDSIFLNNDTIESKRLKVIDEEENEDKKVQIKEQIANLQAELDNLNKKVEPKENETE